MGSLLTNIDNSMKTGDKETYKWLYNNHKFYLSIFSHCDVSRGKEYPYFHIWDAKLPIDIRFDAYLPKMRYSMGGYIIKHWYNEEKDAYVIPSWVQFKVNYNGSRKHPERNHVLLYVDTRNFMYKKVIFENGLTETIKQFDNCIVEIVEW